MKYEALESYFRGQTRAKLRMSFDEVAKAAKTKLPASAYRYPAWWANDPSNHVQARAWVEAGYKTAQVDMAAQRVEFVRTEQPERGVREMQERYDQEPVTPVKKHPAAGALKGTFTISPEWDVTKPALDEDELAEWEANIERMADRVGLPRKK